MEEGIFEKIEIELYEHGFHNFGINCFDEPIAYLSGIYNKKNYFYYIYQYCIRANWGDITFGKNQTEILKILGLNFKEENYTTIDDFLEKIVILLKKKIPIVVALDYYYLFYNLEFFKECHAPHGVIISGLDFKKNLIIIRENCHVSWRAPYYELSLELNVFLKILKKSNDYFKKNSCKFNETISSLYYEKNKTYFSNRFYIVENNTGLKNQFELPMQEIIYLKKILLLKRNNLSSELVNYTHLKEIFTNNNLTAAQFKRNYLETIEVICNIIKKKKIQENEYCFEKIVRKRSVLISKILMNILRSKSSLKFEISELNNEIKNFDDDIYKICRRILKD